MGTISGNIIRMRLKSKFITHLTLKINYMIKIFLLVISQFINPSKFLLLTVELFKQKTKLKNESYLENNILSEKAKIFFFHTKKKI